MSLPPDQAARAALARLWPDFAGGLTRLQGGSLASVFRASGTPQPAVVKVWTAEAQAKAAQQAQRQMAVAQAMTDPQNRAAEVLSWQPEIPALVMEDAGPMSLRDQASRAPLATLRRAGAWIEAFHATTQRPHPFRPAGHVNHLRRLIDQGETGQRQMPRFAQFRATALRIAETGKALRGHPAFRCVTHRDLTLSNLMAAPDGAVIGIDFENDRQDEPLRDVFALAMDSVPIAQDTGTGDLFAAASGAYGRRLAGDDTRLFMQRALALGYWARTPPRPSLRQAAPLSAAVWILEQDRPLI